MPRLCANTMPFYVRDLILIWGRGPGTNPCGYPGSTALKTSFALKQSVNLCSWVGVAS